MHQGSGGIIDVEGENLIVVEGLEGTVHVRAGKAGELRFECRSLDNRRAEREVGLWIDERRFIIRPPEGSRPQRLLLEIAVAPELAVELNLSHSRIKATGLQGSLKATGSELTVEGRGLGGSLELQIKGGKVDIAGVEQEVRVSGEELQVHLDQIAGFVSLTLSGGAARVGELQDGVEIEIEGTRLVGSAIAGPVNVNANGGSVELQRAMQGGEFRMSEAPLVLAQTEGQLEIETDAAVQFNGHIGGLRLNGNGSSVRGSGVSGDLEVRTSDAEIVIEKLSGASRIEGDGLTVRLQEVKGSLAVVTGSSTVSIEGAESDVSVDNDFGDIVINDAKKAVQVTSRDGNVRMGRIAGPVQLKANGPEVVVGWIGMDRAKNSKLENAGGTLRLEFYPKASCRLDVESKFGRIESSLRDIQVSEDEKEASGVMSRGTRPTIEAVAYGDVFLTYATVKPAQ